MTRTSKGAGGYHGSWWWRTYDRLAEAVDRRIGWPRLPKPLGLAVLAGLRDVLRKKNLHDTTGQPSTELPPLDPPSQEHRVTRTIDGSYNDLDEPRMGTAGSRFGRNVPVDRTHPQGAPDILRPSPREVSRALMTRREFVPVESVNALVAPWLQFMIRDWFSHGTSPREDPWQIELAGDDPWPTSPMTIPRTPPDPTRPPGSTTPPTYVNTKSHWWDASQVYGTSPEYQQFIRSGADGKLRVEPDGSLPLPPGEHGPTTEPGFWIGLAMLQTLLTHEHNAICDMLRGHHPDWSDEELFQRARLILGAVIAKIQTVEWTPAVISHPTTVTAMRANWWGLVGERVSRRFGRISDSEIISGIVGGPTHHYGVPFALTEEFTVAYRMHPLMPDDWEFRSVADDRRLGSYTLRQLSAPDALKILADVGMDNLFYSFGTAHPGLVTLHNFPRDLQEFHRPDGVVVDLAATDIMRERELGVPRYTELRRLLRLPVPTSFHELTDDPVLAEEIARVYDGDIERVDLIVGLFAERRPPGFAFSDTAFRIFILMASRRLNSDRFFTSDFTPALYTREGLDWIADTTMATLLLRHHPELRPVLGATDNAFLPWRKTKP